MRPSMRTEAIFTPARQKNLKINGFMSTFRISGRDVYTEGYKPY